MHDKLGRAIKLNDTVLVAENGPYLQWGRVCGLITEPRDGIEIMVAFQHENDPANPVCSKIQTINSPHRVVVVNNAPYDDRFINAMGVSREAFLKGNHFIYHANGTVNPVVNEDHSGDLGLGVERLARLMERVKAVPAVVFTPYKSEDSIRMYGEI